MHASANHGEFPYVFLDATYVKARSGGRIVSRAVIVATGVSQSVTVKCSASKSATPKTERFLETLDELLSSPQRYATMRAAASQLSGRFSWDRTAREFQSFLDA